MEIKTSTIHREAENSEATLPPDRSFARKKTSQKLQRSRRLVCRVLAAFKWMVVTGAVALLAAGVLYTCRYVYTSDLLALRHITVEGCSHLSPGTLEVLIRQEFPQNLLRLDLDQLRIRLEREPWIRGVEMRRMLPASLQIRIQERTPSVIAEIGGELALLASEGFLLDRYSTGYGKFDVPVFRGMQGENAEAYTALQQENSARVRLGVQVLAELGGGSVAYTRAISEVDLSDPGNVRVLLVDDTAEISLGDKDFLKRFQDFLAQYPKAKAQYGEMISVDLRFYPQIVYRPRYPAGSQETPGTGTSQGPK
jgi:cell division protein FtsQ